MMSLILVLSRFPALLALLMGGLLAIMVTNKDWDGSPIQINSGDSAIMQQTPDGSMILAYQNKATMNNQGALLLSSAGSQPQSLIVPAQRIAPSILIHNWQANNLNLVNLSRNKQTPIWIQAFGPGMPGEDPVNLDVGTSLQMAPLGVATANTTANAMSLTFTFNSSQLAIFGIIGGPTDSAGNNAYVIALNYPNGDAGPGTLNSTKSPPPGYYATVGGNTYTFYFNWGGAIVDITYFGSATVVPSGMAPLAAPPPLATVTLMSL